MLLLFMRHKSTVYSQAFHEQHNQSRDQIKRAKKDEIRREVTDLREGQSDYRKKLSTKKK